MRIALLIVLLAACSKSNPNYCEGHPDNNCMVDADVNAPQGCQANDDCTNAAKPLCDVGAKVCVACLDGDIGACSGATPVCTSEHTCAACAAHTDCDSRACLPDGSCAMESQVAYVAASGTGNACTKMAPCPLVKDALGKNTLYIKIAAEGAAKDSSTVTIDGKTVTILADPGATLDRDGDGPILEVRSANADVRIYDLEITGATGTSGGDGVVVTANGGLPKLALTRVTVTENQGAGVSVSGGALTMSQCTISTNEGGGISVAGIGSTFDITNNYIFRNGDQDSGTYGGVNLSVAGAGSSRLEFNTIIDNRAAAITTRSGGVICDITGFAAANNIIARNSLSGSTAGSNAQTIGICTYPTSKTQADLTGLELAHPDMAPFSYKLRAGSSAVDQATTASSVDVDADGDLRPQGAQKDIGADELE